MKTDARSDWILFSSQNGRYTKSLRDGWILVDGIKKKPRVNLGFKQHFFSRSKRSIKKKKKNEK